jgi:hypothetical protein
LWWISTVRSIRPTAVCRPNASFTWSSIRERFTSANRSANVIAAQ